MDSKDSTEPKGKERCLNPSPERSATITTTLPPPVTDPETMSNPDDVSNLSEEEATLLRLLQNKLKRVEEAKKTAESNISEWPFFASGLWQGMLEDPKLKSLAEGIIRFGKFDDPKLPQDPLLQLMEQIVATAARAPSQKHIFAEMRLRFALLSQEERAQMKLVVLEFCNPRYAHLFYV